MSEEHITLPSGWEKVRLEEGEGRSEDVDMSDGDEVKVEDKEVRGEGVWLIASFEEVTVIVSLAS